MDSDAKAFSTQHVMLQILACHQCITSPKLEPFTWPICGKHVCASHTYRVCADAKCRKREFRKSIYLLNFSAALTVSSRLISLVEHGAD